MTAEQDLSADKAEHEPSTDRQGYVTIVKDDTEAKIVPSSLHVWQDQGWSLKLTDPQSKPEPTDLSAQTPQED